MQCRHSLLLASAALFVYMSQASAATMTSPPNWSPMVMFGLEVSWTNPADPSQGGAILIDGRSSSAAAPDTPATARNLKNAGWPLVNGTTFQAGDVFAAPYDVLNGTSFGRSFGWYASADLPAGYVWKIVETSATAGLKVYDPYAASFRELFGSADGNAITYNGNASNYPGPDQVNGSPEYTDQMLHPVFAVPAQTGPVFAQFAIYLAAADGSVVANVTPAYERFNFNATPEPATLLLAGAGGALLAIRRRVRRRSAC
jgi:hypothetical protein